MQRRTVQRRAWLLVACLALVAPQPVLGQAGGLPLGTPGPPVTLQDLDASDAQLLDYRGDDATLIEFWASWCLHCRALEPQLDRIRELYGDRVGIVAVAVAVSQTIEDVRNHVEEHAPGHPYLWDGQGAAVRAYGITTTGVVVILDGQGRVTYTGVGSDQDLLGAMERILAGR